MSQPALELTLVNFKRDSSKLSMDYSIGGEVLHKTYAYQDVDLIDLESTYGRKFMERIYFHIIAMEALPLASLRPTTMNFGPLAHHATPAFESMWRTVFLNCGGQWRYEHNLPEYRGPAFNRTTAHDQTLPRRHVASGCVNSLLFVGGGKDSLVAAAMLQRAAIPYATYTYSHPTYGCDARQHRLVDGLVEQTASRCHHTMCIHDDLAREIPATIARSFGAQNLLYLLCAETPISIFGVLPVVLRHGYQQIILAHERSADQGNFRWRCTGEEINHQWGKSLAAERLICDYLRREMIPNLSYFSILKPISDVLIFNLLRESLEAVRHTHSCNIRKPWCGGCAKCAYVWLSYMAYLPCEVVREVFPANLLDAAKTQRCYRQLMGLESHKPFECVGEIDEVHLAFEMCRAKGLKGAALDTYRRHVPRPDINRLANRYLQVHVADATFPPDVARRVLPRFAESAAAARRYVLDLLVA